MISRSWASAPTTRGFGRILLRSKPSHGDAAGRVHHPVHHQTFRLSVEPFREPIERFTRTLTNSPERIALREIGETFVLPP